MILNRLYIWLVVFGGKPEIEEFMCGLKKTVQFTCAKLNCFLKFSMCGKFIRKPALKKYVPLPA